MPRTSATRASLALPPARGFLILTCMDARLDPAKYAGLAEGDAHVVRNAGGRATDDAIRSMVISHKLLGTREWFVVEHTDCGMLYFDDTAMGDLLADCLEPAELTAQGFRNTATPGGSPEGRYIKWHTIADQEQAVIDDVTRIRHHPLVDPSADLRLHLRRQDRPLERGRRRHRSRRSGIKRRGDNEFRSTSKQVAEKASDVPGPDSALGWFRFRSVHEQDSFQSAC